MNRLNKTKNNLESVWNDLDIAHEHIERAIENLTRMTGLPKNMIENIKMFDLSKLTGLKNDVEILIGDK